MDKKILVAYFSASGVTAAAAKKLAEAAGADLFEILPEKAYTAADLDWRDRNSRSTLEMKDPSSRPAIAARCERIADYDLIFLGFPIWWYVAPTIVNTFLESHDLSGKRVVLFATSGGSGFGKTAQRLKESVSPGATLAEGRLFNGNLDKTSLAAWAESELAKI